MPPVTLKLADRTVTYPALRPEHLKSARLYSDKTDMFRGLVRSSFMIGEIGVGFGMVSRELLRVFNPAVFVAFDRFDLHKAQGTPEEQCNTAGVFSGLTHREYYKQSFADRQEVELVCEQGTGAKRLNRYRDKSFDILYMDAGDGTGRTIAQAARKVCDNGLLIVNGYVINAEVEGPPVRYGIVPAVNLLVDSQGWKVVGLALNPHMLCDVALLRQAYV